MYRGSLVSVQQGEPIQIPLKTPVSLCTLSFQHSPNGINPTASQSEGRTTLDGAQTVECIIGLTEQKKLVTYVFVETQ